MSTLIDSHCHLDFEVLRSDIKGVIDRAHANDIAILQTICTQISKIHEIIKIAQDNESVFCSVGNHPLNLKEEGIIGSEEIIKYCILPKVIGVGETGLDYYYADQDRATQISSFREHIIASQSSGLPLIVHTRSADDDTISIIREHMTEKKFSGVIHCFTASRKLAEYMIDCGFYISASGILTFKNTDDIKAVFRNVPEERILIETDAPFLSPVPLRGKVNEPSYLKFTAQILADLRGISFSDIARITTSNFFRLFPKARVATALAKNVV